MTWPVGTGAAILDECEDMEGQQDKLTDSYILLSNSESRPADHRQRVVSVSKHKQMGKVSDCLPLLLMGERDILFICCQWLFSLGAAPVVCCQDIDVWPWFRMIANFFLGRCPLQQGQSLVIFFGFYFKMLSLLTVIFLDARSFPGPSPKWASAITRQSLARTCTALSTSSIS